MTAPAHGTCPICSRSIAVKLDGKLARHRRPGLPGHCQGSGMPPLGPWHPHRPATAAR